MLAVAVMANMNLVCDWWLALVLGYSIWLFYEAFLCGLGFAKCHKFSRKAKVNV